MTKPQALLQIPCPFLDGYGVVHLLEPLNTPLQPLWEALQNGTYQRPFVLEQDGQRALHFSLRYIQSTMDMANPSALTLEYTAAMMAFLLFVPTPREMVLAGLGGGSLVRFIYENLLKTKLSVIENNQDVIDLAPAFYLPRPNERLAIHAGDALVDIRQLRDVDVLVLDIFDRDGLIPGLADLAFLTEVKDCLAPEGMVVMNLAGDKPVWQAVLEQTRAVFGHEVFIIPVLDGPNYIVLARPPQRQPVAWRKLKEHAQLLQMQYGLEFPKFAEQMERAHKLNYITRLLNE